MQKHRTRVMCAAFVAAVLAASGCGGGSSEPQTNGASGATGTNAASSDTASAAATGAAASPSSPSSENGAAGGTAAEGGATGGPATGGGGSAGQGSGSGEKGAVAGAKHGPRLPQPKGPPEPKITPQERSEATVAGMILRSPASQPTSGQLDALPSQYTCDGKNTSPALHWQGVPQGTVELALFAMNVQPVNGKLFFDWAVAGLDPGLGEIDAGKLPKGAVVGRNSFGNTDYEICPEGAGEIYMFALYALPKKLSPAKGFEPHDLRQAVLDASGDVGLLPLTYTRG